MKLKQVVALNVRLYRQKAELTQEQLAMKCKMHDNYISKVELGKVSIGIENLEKIAKALRIHPSLLLIDNASQ